MNIRFFYLHIAKTAGTSFRELLQQNYGREKVFWYGIHSDLQEYKPRETEDFLIAGGHRAFPFLNDIAYDMLYSGVVRDPIDRIKSLFNFLVADTCEKDRNIWLQRGLVAESVVKSVENCPMFRVFTENAQCRMLSGEKNFIRTMNTLTDNNYVVGHFDQLNSYISTLGTLLNWPYRKLSLKNAGRPDYQNKILFNDSEIEYLQDITHEDAKLYDAVKQEGVFVNIRNKDLLASLSPRQALTT